MSARIFTSSSRALRLAPNAALSRRTITQSRSLGLKETASSMFPFLNHSNGISPRSQLFVGTPLLSPNY